MKRTTSGPLSDQSGMVLLAVLWITILLSLLVAGFTAAVVGDAREVANRRDLVRAQALAEAGLARAALGLLDARDDFRWRADGRLYGFTFDGTALAIAVLDENGRVDLNKAGEPLLAALFGASGLEPEAQEELLAALLDWRDADDDRRPLGAEDRDYRQAGADFGAGDAPLAHQSQLRSLLGMTREAYEDLLPLSTVNGRSGRINPLTATKDALALLSASGPEAIEQLLSLREETPPDVAAIRAALGADAALLDFNSGPVYAVTVMAELPSGLRFEREAVIWLQPDAEAAYRVLEWRDPQIPSSLREAWAEREKENELANPPAGGAEEDG